MSLPICFLLLISVACGICQAQTHVYLFDQHSKFFNPVLETVDLNPSTLSVFLSSLLGTQPAVSSDQIAYDKVESLLKPDVFKRPHVLLSLQLAGVDSGIWSDLLSTSAASTTLHLTVSKTGLAAGADSASDAVLALNSVATYPSAVEYRALDYTGLPHCGDACMEQGLEDALATLGANYTRGPGQMMGRVQLKTPGSTGSTTLNLEDSVPARLWAIDIAALHQTISDAIAEKSRREAQEGAPEVKAELLDSTLVGMLAVKAHYGAESPEYAAALATLQTLLTRIQADLGAAYDDMVVTQIMLLGDVTPGGPSWKSLLKWREVNRRRSLLTSVGTDSEEDIDAALKWTTKAAAWLTFIIFIAFLIGACCCIGNMHFKQDTLLYARTKAD